MADNKKAIIVYADWIKKFEELTDDEAGKLIKHFFRYVNDLNPIAPDRTTKLLFIDIENSLKRDLKKWELRAERSRENGSKGGRPPKENPEKPEETQQVILKPRKPDSVTVSVSVNDDDKSSYPFFTIIMLLGLPFGNNEFTRYACSQTNRNIEELISLREKFVSEQKALSKLSWPNEQDAKKHFINWVKKQPTVNSKPLHLQRIQ